jgi:hypothetical protein
MCELETVFCKAMETEWTASIGSGLYSKVSEK